MANFFLHTTRPEPNGPTQPKLDKNPTGTQPESDSNLLDPNPNLMRTLLEPGPNSNWKRF